MLQLRKMINQLQTNRSCFYSVSEDTIVFTNFFFFTGTLEKHLVLHVGKLGCEFAIMFVFISFCANLTRDTSLVSQKKLMKFVYFFRSSHLQIFFNLGVFKIFGIFPGKHLCWSLIFSCEYYKILRTAFLQNTSGGCFYFLKRQCINVPYFE